MLQKSANMLYQKCQSQEHVSAGDTSAKAGRRGWRVAARIFPDRPHRAGEGTRDDCLSAAGQVAERATALAAYDSRPIA